MTKGYVESGTSSPLPGNSCGLLCLRVHGGNSSGFYVIDAFEVATVKELSGITVSVSNRTLTINSPTDGIHYAFYEFDN